MKKGIIICRSKYGATRKYAEWLQQATGFDVVETKKADIKKIREYDTVVLGGGVYASGIAGLGFLKKNIAQLAGKRVAVFAVGASPYDAKAINEIRKLHFSDMLRDVPLFYCRGIWDKEAMTFVDRSLCNMLKKAVAKQDQSAVEPWMAALLSTGDEKCDWTDAGYLDPLIAYLSE